VVLIGDNNVGKTTVLEALDLVLGPERLNCFPIVGEHDFYNGRYVALDSSGETNTTVSETEPEQADESDSPEPQNDKAEVADDAPAIAPHIVIEVVIIGLSDEQKATFGGYADWWDISTDKLYDSPSPEGVDAANITQALRVTFIGQYDPVEDDFEGHTYFTRSIAEDENPTNFNRRHKQLCGFLYLRSLRTGTRALSLQRGSLLDIILRLKEIRPQMWEAAISDLSSFPIAADEELGISGVLKSINKSLRKYVPEEWAAKPQLRVSDLTREHLRKIVTAFVATGDGDHAAPFNRQGSGTVNMLVLAMLSQIAEDKQNVIFAMEEPETAIPPYAQKRIVHEVRNLSSQTIFTSHSPYVLEEFELNEAVVLSRNPNAIMEQSSIELPDSVKLKRYRQEFRTRFCEGLLARRVLLAEGATEAAAIPTAARRLAELNTDTYSSLEALGICTIDAGSENNIPDMAGLYKGLGKRVFAVCDKQTPENKAKIDAQVEACFMHDESAIEKLVLDKSTPNALERFADLIEWPQHILDVHPDPKSDLTEALRKYFDWSKGNWGIADFLAQCQENEMPEWIRNTCKSLRKLVNPNPSTEDTDTDDPKGIPEESDTNANTE
jgi:putative ATP-dependent endonuclease of OLD family